MTPSRLARRSLWHYRRTHFAVLLGVIAATAALTGALLVGDSMRASLRKLALGRLGSVQAVEVLPFFLTDDSTDNDERAIVLPAAIVNPASEARVNGATAYGLLDGSRFSKPAEQALFPKSWSGPNAVVNSAVAAQLGLQVGDDIILRVRTPKLISSELLLGRRDESTTSVRATVQGIVSAGGFGGFTPNPRQFEPACVFVPRELLERALNQPNGYNASLWTYDDPDFQLWRPSLRIRLGVGENLGGLGLRLAPTDRSNALVLDSMTMLLPAAVESAVVRAAGPDSMLRTDLAQVRFEVSPVINYLANSIELVGSDKAVPYSTVVAIDPDTFVIDNLPNAQSDRPLTLRRGEILLNDWAVDDLGAKIGDTIRLTYYVTGEFGKLKTASAEFRLAGVVALRDGGADPTFTPEYPGVTDAKRMGDWDPPFPVDLDKVRDKDEDYWDAHRATPKAYIPLADGERLWTKPDAPLGSYTSYRIKPPMVGEALGDRTPSGLESRAQPTGAPESRPTPGSGAMDAAQDGPEAGPPTPTPGSDPSAPAASFKDLDEARTEFLNRFSPKPEDVGIRFIPVRENAERAARGSTDFGGLFIGFSFFLIASAAMLVALLFRLGVERRAVEIGTLRAVGLPPAAIRGLLLYEGGLVAFVGVALGLAAAAGYAWLMLAGLRTWWSAAANAPFLMLSVSPMWLTLGGVLSFTLALGSIAYSLRGLTRRPPTELLAGAVQSGRESESPRAGRVARIIAAGALVAAIGVLAAAMLSAMPATAGFFGGGALLLIAALALVRVILTARSQRILHEPGKATLARLGLRNAQRQPGRSMLTAALIASAAFVVTSLAAFRMDADVGAYAREGPTGGYRMFADSTAPLVYDLNAAAGRREMDLPPALDALLDGVTIMPFRLRDGDAASCLNLYTKTQPRILGATPAQVARGGFRFQSALKRPGYAPDNPWTLLDSALEGPRAGVPTPPTIPVIADEAAVHWQLHSSLGGTIEITDARGRQVKLQFVALLSGSVLQDELIMSEANFRLLFPNEDGYRFFLIDAPADKAAAVEQALERDLSDYGVAVSSTADRLRGYLAVQNTYITTFQMLGGLGLVLGTVGLIAVLLRNVWERRRELALLQAVGYTNSAVQTIVLAENVALVAAGLLAGVIPAVIAIAPVILQRPEQIPWLTLSGTLAGVLLIGIGAAAIAVRQALRGPLLPALRSE